MDINDFEEKEQRKICEAALIAVYEGYMKRFITANMRGEALVIKLTGDFYLAHGQYLIDHNDIDDAAPGWRIAGRNIEPGDIYLTINGDATDTIEIHSSYELFCRLNDDLSLSSLKSKLQLFFK